MATSRSYSNRKKAVQFTDNNNHSSYTLRSINAYEKNKVLYINIHIIANAREGSWMQLGTLENISCSQTDWTCAADKSETSSCSFLVFSNGVLACAYGKAGDNYNSIVSIPLNG